jgi:Ca2+-binding EF-hand superfamily protein
LSGDEITRELPDAWYLYTKGEEQIRSRDIGHVLRILGQNPTEDDVVDMVMKANCEWEGLMGFTEFLDVGIEILRTSCNQMDDVKAAFRVFDHNNDGSISKDELREAMVNFGTRCTDDEFDLMFQEADSNQDGKIDFDEFVAMMLPSTLKSPEQEQHAGPKRPT